MSTHWGRVTHICIGKQTNIGSDNGLSPGRRQAIIWTNAGILLIGSLGTNFSEVLSEIYIFSRKKMHLKMLSAKRQPFCLGLNGLSGYLIQDSFFCYGYYYMPRIMQTFWSVNILVYQYFGLWIFQSMFADVLECQHFGQCFGLWIFQSMFADVLECQHFDLSMFWFVDISVNACRLFGVSVFWFVNVWVCGYFSQCLQTF